jgi:hypothetical protein
MEVSNSTTGRFEIPFLLHRKHPQTNRLMLRTEIITTYCDNRSKHTNTQAVCVCVCVCMQEFMYVCVCI